jgi:hypothetical protein
MVVLDILGAIRSLSRRSLGDPFPCRVPWCAVSDLLPGTGSVRIQEIRVQCRIVKEPRSQASVLFTIEEISAIVLQFRKDDRFSRHVVHLLDSRTLIYNWPCHIGVSFNCEY